MNILVTGYAGFIGSHLTEALIELGHNVVGVDCLSPYYDVRYKIRNMLDAEAKGCVNVIGDLASRDVYKRLPTDFDLIYHCAAQPGLDAKVSFETYLKNNVVATQYLSEWAQGLTHLKALIYISTSSVYGTYATCSETEQPQPSSFYGVTKLAAEQLLLALNRQKLLNVCSVRLYSVYGSRERPDKMFSRLIISGLKGQPFPLYNGSMEHRRSFTHIHDIIDGLVSVIGHIDDCIGEIINLGNDQDYSMRAAFEMVEELIDTKINVEHLDSRKGDQMKTRANIDKARRLIKFEPKVSLEKGVSEQVAWFREILNVD